MGDEEVVEYTSQDGSETVMTIRDSDGVSDLILESRDGLFALPRKLPKKLRKLSERTGAPIRCWVRAESRFVTYSDKQWIPVR